MTETTQAEGWTFPTATARRAHYFRDRRSLCRDYGLPIHREQALQPDTGHTSPEDCIRCTRKLRGDA